MKLKPILMTIFAGSLVYTVAQIVFEVLAKLQDVSTAITIAAN
jgi:hypothetical protein